jgi:hypothetical protein
MAATTNAHVTASTVNISTQKATVEAEYKALITGINSELVDETHFMLNGTLMAKPELVAHFQSRLDAAEKTKTQRTALHATVGAEHALNLEVAPLRMGFKTYLQSRYGKNSPELQKFGFTPAKKPQRPVAAKATGIAKNQATRIARNTIGKKAKLQIKGTVPSSSAAPTPATPPAAPAKPAIASTPGASS